jgi:hypothetical protein
MRIVVSLRKQCDESNTVYISNSQKVSTKSKHQLAMMSPARKPSSSAAGNTSGEGGEEEEEEEGGGGVL